jgi:hypothetical protein
MQRRFPHGLGFGPWPFARRGLRSSNSGLKSPRLVLPEMDPLARLRSLVASARPGTLVPVEEVADVLSLIDSGRLGEVAADWRPAPGQDWSPSQLAREFPRGDGKPRTPRCVVQWIERGEFGACFTPGAPYKQLGQWRVPHSAVDGFKARQRGERLAA